MSTSRIRAAGLALALLFPAAAVAQPPEQAPEQAATQAPTPEVRKQTPPPVPPAEPVSFPAFAQKTLPNGLRLVVVEQHETPAVSISLMVPAGQAFADPAKAGVAGATASLLTKGTASRTAQQIAEEIDFVGGALNAFAGLEQAQASSRVTSDQIDRGLDLLADVVLHPTFPEEELERWRKQTLSGLQVNQQDAGYVADQALRRLLFPEHPYGPPGSGTPESVGALTRDDLATFHRERYRPNDAILAIVGDVKPEEAFAKAEKRFGGWPKAEQAAAVPPVPESRPGELRIVVVDKPDAVQTEVRLGQRGIAYTDDDHFVAEVYNAVLGAGSSDRLYREIRRDRGLAYGVGSGFVEPSRPGWFLVSTSTKTESTVEALQVALDVLRGLEKEPVPMDELERNKAYITGAFPLEIETPQGIAAKVLEALEFGYGKEYLETYNERLSAVTPAQVLDFAKRRIHPEALTVVLVGNASRFGAELKEKVGKFTTIPLAEVDLLRPDLRRPAQEEGADPEG
jgi:zinc protease